MLLLLIKIVHCVVTGKLLDVGLFFSVFCGFCQML